MERTKTLKFIVDNLDTICISQISNLNISL